MKNLVGLCYRSQILFFIGNGSKLSFLNKNDMYRIVLQYDNFGSNVEQGLEQEEVDVRKVSEEVVRIVQVLGSDSLNRGRREVESELLGFK